MSANEIIYLPHQADFIDDITTRYLGLISGFGAGKTFSFCQKAIDLAERNAGHTGMLLEPNAPLLHDILIPEFEKALDDMMVPYTLKKSPNHNYTLHFPGGDTLVMLRSFENWEKLIGVNASFIGVDEIDVVKEDIATKAVQKLQGRLRSGKVRQMFFTTTPEGFRWAYNFFVVDDKPSKRMIQASTEDNIFLPQDFIDSLYEMYPPNLIKAYLHGKFVNLQGNTVYEYFDRRENTLKVVDYDKTDEILVGMDFNVGGCVSIIAVEDYDNDELYVIDVIVKADTFKTGSELKLLYGDYYDTIVHPDSSGGSRSTNSTTTDLDILSDEFGLNVNAPNRNPNVIDRVLSVNNMFRHKKLFIVENERTKPLLDALERQVYDKKGKPEKFDVHPSIDDYCDALGYLVHRRYPVLRPTISQYKSVA